ncbi:sugar ABC transporter ATP-binding protein [Mumia sp. zg.B17]|uniref:sugar ABC transporter ATP-binding protein n=1 Tax=Mumia sp. zg.B17 TaxID=2855446 RepID=UPI0021064510|nr:sugar ABC transporter ATP-binding protein [Mumia sp. zg.B17]
MTHMSADAYPSSGTSPRGRTPVDPVVQMTGITIRFPGVTALDDVDFRLFPGEVHALLGENGAGKSTLIKALTGVYATDSGTIWVGGAEHAFTGPAAAQDAGVSTVYQEVNLCTNLSVAENMLLGREPRRLGRIDHRGMNRRASEVLGRLGLDISPRSRLGDHPIAVQQLVAIGRAVDIEARVLVLDEPTASLDSEEVAKLFEVVRSLRSQGVAILFVSHFLEQVFAISDRMTVLRNGRIVGEHLTRDVTRLELVEEMLGRELEVLERLHREPSRQPDERRTPVLRARGLGRKGSLAPTDLDVYDGEVIGIAGLLGSGRTELARLLFGADASDSGSVEVRGRRVALRSPRRAVDHKIGFSSENRRSEGVIGDLTVAENMMLGLQAARGWLRPVPPRTRDQLVIKHLEMLDIRPANPDALMRNLSGGNQQKVLLARWLIMQPDVLLLDEPTRGIDVGAKAQIQQVVDDLAYEGMGIVFISAELEEVLRLSDRLVVMRDRHKVDEIPNTGVTTDDLMAIIAREEESARA